MNWIQFIVVLTLFLTTTTTLHINSEHLNIDNTADYLQGLLSRQSQFQASLNVLSKDVNDTVAAATNVTDIESKILILEQGILNQQNQIFLTSTALIPVLVLKDQCQNISDVDRYNLIQKCQTTIQDLQVLLGRLQSLPQDARILQLQASANHQIYYLTTIQSVLMQNCTSSAVLSPTAYQSNIYAPNWITGNQTINDIVNQYIARSQQYDNITNCPLSAPFYNGYQCISCTNPYPIFDMKALVCTNCPIGQVLDTQSKVCVFGVPAQPNATNIAAGINYLGPQPILTPYDVPCPSLTPYYNGITCITCPPENSIFNGTSGQCTTCPIGTQFNTVQHLCTQGASNVTNPIILTNPNVTGTLPPQSPYDIPCPAMTPIFYNGQCISAQCPASNPILNITSLTCFTCPVGLLWDPNSQSCVSQFQNPNGPNPIGQNQTIGTLVPGTIPCPVTQPFWNGINCFNCYAPTSIFNASTQQCTACTSGYYNSTSYSCYYYNGTNPIYNGSIMNPQNVTSPDTIYCPQQTPYFNGTGCINCTDPYPYFDQALKICFQCPNGTTLNSTNHTCQTGYPNASNPSAANSSIGPIYTAGPNDIPCPTTTPFFVNGQCINCSFPTGNFNSSSQTCTSCPYNTAYNSTYQNCLPCQQGYTYNSSSQTCTLCPQGLIYNYTYQNCTPCPPGLIYNSTYQSCTPCPQNTTYNSTYQNCTPCPQGTTYNATNQNCTINPLTVNYVSNLTGVSWVSATPFADFVQNGNDINNRSNTPCPVQTPFFNGYQCINCTGNGQYFNVSTSQCVTCPFNTTFVLVAKKCVPNTPALITNPNNALNLLYDTYPPNLWKSWYSSNISTYHPTDCFTPTPYYNGIQCISCNSKYPYFNLQMMDCVTCPTSYVYQNSQCINTVSNQLSPNLASMAATAFTHQTVNPYQHKLRHRII